MKFSYSEGRSFIVALLFFLPVIFFNKLIFDDQNLIFFIIILGVASVGESGMKKVTIFNRVTLVFLVFILFVLCNYNNITNSIVSNNRQNLLVTHVINISYLLIIFILSANLFYKKQKINLSIGIFIAIYIVAFVARNLGESEALRTGYNLSPGIALFSAIPFLYICFNPKKVTLFITVPCILWLGYIGARTATLSLIIMVFIFFNWERIFKSKKRYDLFFLISSIVVFGLVIIYLLTAVSGAGGFLDQLSINIFGKRLGTRSQIWLELIFHLRNDLWIGLGSVNTSSSLSPLFSGFYADAFQYRKGLEAHSTFFEIFVRGGLFGLIIIWYFFYALWNSFWSYGKPTNAQKISGSMLIAVFLFSQTTNFLFFESLLRSSFVWCLLGLGFGSKFHSEVKR